VLVAAIVGAATDVRAEARGIVEPTADAPSRPEPGTELRAIVRLRLPLTPPPGVQQPRAWKGWSVRLVRSAQLALFDADGSVEYPARLLRIRPAGDQLYRVSAKTLPWMAPGRYDLLIDGPGFAGRAAAAVIVPGKGPGEPPPGLEPRLSGEGSSIELRNGGAEPAEQILEVVVPADHPGVRVTRGERELAPSYVTWSRPPAPEAGSAPRLLAFAVEVPGASGDAPGIAHLRSAAVAPRGECRLALEWERPATRRPTEWQTIRADTGDDSQIVIWDYGDGEWGIGSPVRHRWLFDPAVRLRASSLDRYGRVCSAARQLQLDSPTDRAGCGCAQVGARNLGDGRGAGPGDLAGALLGLALAIFFLSPARTAE